MPMQQGRAHNWSLQELSEQVKVTEKAAKDNEFELYILDHEVDVILI